MHFFYLDESGCTGRDLTNRDQPVFVLGGLSVRDKGWDLTHAEVVRVTSAYFGGNLPQGFELHSDELLSPNGDGPFAGHDRGRRNRLALDLLAVLVKRKHGVHVVGIDKRKILATAVPGEMPYDVKAPYLLAYDYLISHIDWTISTRLGRSAMGMIILDDKREFSGEISRIALWRRSPAALGNPARRITEFSHAVDSAKNPMVQLSDLIVYVTRRFLEMEGGYRPGWAPDCKTFYAEAFGIVESRLVRAELVARGRPARALDGYLGAVRASASRGWRAKYAAAPAAAPA